MSNKSGRFSTAFLSRPNAVILMIREEPEDELLELRSRSGGADDVSMPRLDGTRFAAK